jgi:hypothetical protein
MRSMKMAMALALLSSAGGMGTVQAGRPIETSDVWLDEWPKAPAKYGTRGAGITMAQQKRIARKVRNVKRHKRAARGDK